MANSYLYDKEYLIPDDIIKYIKKYLILFPKEDGVKRAKFIVKNGKLTYQELKRLKNFFDYYVPNKEGLDVKYALCGGDLMKDFVNSKLESERDAVKREKEIKQNYNVDVNLGTKPYQTPRTEINENSNVDVIENVIAIIFNDNNKILLLRRENNPNIWQPNKWSLVGGAKEKDETPEKGILREIKEETGIDFDDNKIKRQCEIKTFVDGKERIDYIFLAKYNHDDITLNGENVDFGWFNIDEIEYLDTVPFLLEYIKVVLKINKL